MSVGWRDVCYDSFKRLILRAVLRGVSPMVARLLSVSLILDHGNIFGKEDETGACDDEVLRCFEAISDPEEQSRFYAKHKKELMAASEARKNNP